MKWFIEFGLPWHQDWKDPINALFSGASGPPPLPYTTSPFTLWVDVGGYDPIYEVSNPGWVDADSVTRKWFLNDVEIPGETGTTYQSSNLQNGDELKVVETGINIYGSTIATSNVIVFARPVNTVAPSIAGDEGNYHNHGVSVTRSIGTWTGATTYSGQWYKNGVAISGATGSSYVIPNTWALGDILSYRQFAYTADGVMNFHNSNTLVAEAPTLSIAPVITAATGSDNVGDILSVVTAAVFSHGATTTRKWRRGASDIFSQFGTSYTLISADFGSSIYIRYTGTNSYGTLDADSNAFVAGFVPVATQAPVISAWTNGSPPTVTTPPDWDYETTVTGQWRKNGADVVGQTGTTYAGTYNAGDVMVYRSIATNTYGSVNSDSNAVTISLTMIYREDALMNFSLTGISGDTINQTPLNEALLKFTLTGTKV